MLDRRGARRAIVAILLPLWACSAGRDPDGGGGLGGGASGPGTGGNGGAAGPGGAGAGGAGAGFADGGSGGAGGTLMDPCNTACGPVELCDGIHKGLDNNCNGVVDEDCPCNAGDSWSCFKGEPAYADAEGCAPGTMHCTELGTWGPCVGGNHAVDMCFMADPLACHPIHAVPFQIVDLRLGAGNFDDDAVTDSFSVSCPAGVDPCPGVTGTSSYQALQSGEYTVTYTKTVSGNDETCSYPLYIGARGLRVELAWNYSETLQWSDLDLHMHEPMTTTGWGVNIPQDCDYANCKATNFIFPSGEFEPQWFPSGNTPPDPVNWFDAPNDEEDLCYYAPRGAGAEWQAAGMGCHSPRLDLDNIACDTTLTDPEDPEFCAPENINIDFPPKEQWIRVAVHYYPGTTNPGVTFPNLKIFCDGKQAAELGTFGFNTPESPVEWSGANDLGKLWVVADVAFHEDECGNTCVVSPIYADENARTPYIVPISQEQQSFTPDYPPLP